MSSSPKTQPTGASVAGFIDAVPDPQRQADCRQVGLMMQTAAGEPPVMWGTAIVGFGRYRSSSGDWPIIGFSPRKQELVLYLMDGLDDQARLLQRLGRHRTGKSCLYLKRLADVDLSVLDEIIHAAVAAMADRRLPARATPD